MARRSARREVGLRRGLRPLPCRGLVHKVVIGQVPCRISASSHGWSTRWDERATDGFSAYLARLGWRNYCVKGDPEILELCPDCAVRALLLGETGGLADTWLRPVRAYTHAVAQVNEQLDARQRVTANLLLTDGRAS